MTLGIEILFPELRTRVKIYNLNNLTWDRLVNVKVVVERRLKIIFLNTSTPRIVK